MSIMVTIFKTTLRTRLEGRRTWLLLLLPLLIFAASRALPARETAAPVQVGVVLPPEGGEAFWEKLQERSGLVVSFLPADAVQAERQVAAGQWDCALLLPKDFQARLGQLDTYHLITVLTGPGSTVWPMVQETAVSCVAELIAPALAEGYLLESGIADGSSIAALRPRLNEILSEQDRVLVSMETVDGRPLDPIALADSGTGRLLAGLLAIVLLASALFTAMDLGRWLESPFVRRLLPLRGPLVLLLPWLAGSLLPVLCAGALALLPLDDPLRYMLPLLPYLLFLGTLALALAQCRPLCSALPVLMPFVLTAALLLSPVLLDLSLLFPALAPLTRWTPVALYLRACGGDWADGLTLLLGAALLLALLWMLDRISARRRPAA